MEILTQAELRLRLREIVNKINEGSLFIHPTDTIYGIGCNALNKNSVDKIRQLKDRTDVPFSIWVPSMKWIKDNCVINKKGNEWINKLPGPYTIIIPLKNKSAVAESVAPGLDSIGIRSPNHWFSEVVKEVGVPIITTSANRAGQPFMTSIEDLDPKIEAEVEFMIYEGEKRARPSKIVHLERGEVKER